jgi:hypothetical protein
MSLKLVSCCLLVVAALATSCVSLDGADGSTTSSPKQKPGAVQSAKETVNAIASAQPSGSIPQHFRPEEPSDIPRQEGDWDVNTYFGALKHLTVQPGYVIDYFYVYDGMGGYPFIYARPADKQPYASYDEWAAALEASGHEPGEHDYDKEYLEHIEVDGTPEGFFELAALRIMAEQFYLYWHAAYNDDAIVYDEESLRRILDSADSSFGGNMIPNALRRAAAKLDVTPTVTFPDDSTAVIRLVTFSMWGGFVEKLFTFSREFPHALLDLKTETLVEYDCGVSF